MLSQEEISILELAVLLGTPVYKIMDDMPYDEFTAWMEYMSVRPPGWKEDRRTYLQLAVAGSKAKPGELFHSLKIMEDNNNNSTGVKGLTNSAFFQRMSGAIGGDKVKGINDENTSK
jgi:hypothetical protein